MRKNQLGRMTTQTWKLRWKEKSRIVLEGSGFYGLGE